MKIIIALLLWSSVAFAADEFHGCKKQFSPNDGTKKGFVWKQSDVKKNSKGELVGIVLFPTQFGKPHLFHTVQLRQKGKTAATLRFCYYDAEHSSPQRQIWRTELAMKNMPAPSVLYADGKCWLLKNPRKRID
jgi:hypothetical protein